MRARVRLCGAVRVRAHYALGETAGTFTGVVALTAYGLLSAVGLVGKTIVF